MKSPNWKLHSQRGWAIATGVSAMFAAFLAKDAGESVMTSALFAGGTAGFVAWAMQCVAKWIAPKDICG